MSGEKREKSVVFLHRGRCAPVRIINKYRQKLRYYLLMSFFLADDRLPSTYARANSLYSLDATGSVLDDLSLGAKHTPCLALGFVVGYATAPQ
jgi:hypothetical protein